MAVTRRSRKRDAILAALLETKSHPTAESIHTALKGDMPDLSLGTVYANLSSFKRDGKALGVAVVDGKERFDGDMSPHAHFICRVCGAVADLNVKLPENPTVNGTIESCQLNWYGLCSQCKEISRCSSQK